MANSIEYLKAHPFFSPFSVASLLHILGASRVATLAIGEVVPADHALILVLDGELSRETARGTDTLNRGHLWTGAGVEDAVRPFRASVEAEVLMVTQAALSDLREREPSVARSLVRRASALRASTAPTGEIWSGRRRFVVRTTRPGLHEESPSRLHLFIKNPASVSLKPGLLIGAL